VALLLLNAIAGNNPSPVSAVPSIWVSTRPRHIDPRIAPGLGAHRRPPPRWSPGRRSLLALEVGENALAVDRRMDGYD
jgi:hypothetical protein